MKMSSTAVVALTVGLILVTLTGKCYGALEVGFYKGKCGRFTGVDVETIVAGVVRTKFLRDRSIAPALIRMQFHDCFVNGCDASILLDGSSSEKTAPPNLSVRGYDVIDSAKTILEGVCPGVVSCADIITMATRDAVSMSGGVWYNVQTGRKDGFVSLASNVDLPAPSISVPQSVAVFAKKGLNTSDMVHLLGGHTVGVAHCNFFQNRLYNFQNTGKPDPTMDSGLLQRLRLVCPQNSAGTNVTNLDQNPRSSAIVDNSFYKEIVAHRGILQIDQEIAQDPRTQAIVTSLADDNTFNTKFGQAMVKLGTIQVLTGSQGEIRRSCRAVNGRRS